MARKTLTDRMVKAIRPTDKRQTIADPECSGLYLRVTEKNAKSWAAVARNPEGKQVWATLGSADHLSVADARAAARKAIVRIKAGLSAFEEPKAKPLTFGEVAGLWIERHVAKKELRSAPEIARILDVYVRPAWQDKPVASIRRGDVVTLLDVIEDERGARQADYVLAVVRGIFNWHAARDDVFVSPVVKGMRRASETKRERVLNDDELRAIWTAATATFGDIVKVCLLTAQRREKVAGMLWQDIDNGTWRVPAARREKGVGGDLRLPKAALDIIEKRPRLASNEHVFSGRGAGPFNSWSESKRALDATSGVTGWTIHDLRRTARSLMPRAGVTEHIAERVLGHKQPGVKGVYDRYTYVQEKGHALAALAGLIERIVSPVANVVALRS